MLRFPAPDDAPEDAATVAANAALAARVAAMYAATPVADAGAADCCARAILTEQMHATALGVGDSVRPRWWWGAAAALVVTAALANWQSRRSSSGTSASPSVAQAAPALSAPMETMPESLPMTGMPFGRVTPVAGGDAIRFDLRLPSSAKAVAIVGDFNGWDAGATPMRPRNGQNSWSAQVELKPGRHVYAFVIDGTRWLVDPLAPQVSDAGFGPSNAVLVEGGPQ